jgi:hypothetical protein
VFEPRRLLLGGALAIALTVACGTDSAGPGTLTDPLATSAALSSLDSAFGHPVVISYGSLGTFIRPGAALSRAAQIAAATRPQPLPAGTPPEVAVARHLAVLRGLAATPTAPQGPIIPDTLYGSIYTWDEASAQYVRSSTSGGPANGVEFVLYAVDPITGDIVSPLNPVGKAQLLDESVGLSAKLHILVQDNAATTYLDYAATLTAGVGSVTVTVTGLVTNGASGGANKTLSFSVSATLTLTTATVHAAFTLNNPALSVVLDAAATSAMGSETVSVTFTFTRPGETVRLQGSIATTSHVLDTLSAEIRVNGQVYATVAGNASGVTFYDKDGNVITDAGAQHDVLEALDHLRHAVEHTLDFIEDLFDPIENLLSG